MHKKVMY